MIVIPLAKGGGRVLKIAVISDIHANLVALEKVLVSIREYQCDMIVCLGDIVGYGPKPNECIQMVEKAADIVLLGNHDYAAIGLMNVDSFNTFASQAIQWTRQQLTPENAKYLQQLPVEKSWQECFFVHASPCNPDFWNYVLSPREAETEFECFEQQLCFLGHSHYPLVFSYHSKMGVNKESSVKMVLEKEKRYIINVGSVGQPRDNNPEASWVLYDRDHALIKRLRISYPVEIVQDQMRDHHLPPFLIERLSHGR